MVTYAIKDTLNSANTALTNATEVEAIATALKAYGYTPQRIQEGRNLYRAVLDAQATQQANYDTQYDTSADLTARRQTSIDTYTKHRKLAQLAITNSRHAQALGLNTVRARNLSGTFAQMEKLYTTALKTPAILAALAEFNLTQAALRQALDDLAAIEAATIERKKHKGTAQAATKTRDRLLQELEDWMRDFKAIAKIALKQDPQQLEALDILVRS